MSIKFARCTAVPINIGRASRVYCRLEVIVMLDGCSIIGVDINASTRLTCAHDSVRHLWFVALILLLLCDWFIGFFFSFSP
jgi:hypothetical protein